MKPASSRLRLTLQQTLSCGMLLLLFACAIYALMWRSALKDVDSRLSDRSATIGSLLAVRDDSAFSLSPVPVTEAVRQVRQSRRSMGETQRLGSSREVRILDAVYRGGETRRSGVMSAGMLLDEGQLRRWPIVGLLLALLSLACVLGVALWVLSRRMLKSVTALSATAKQIDSANLNSQFPPSGGRDFDQLAAALNAMLQRIEGPFKQMQEFLPNISHELRGPLTNMRAAAENALRTAESVEDYRKVLSHQLEQVDLMSATMSDLLELARSGLQPSSLNKHDQNLSELITASVDAIKPYASEHDVELTVAVPRNLHGVFDTRQMCRVLQNLIDNAIKYNQPGGHVSVSAYLEGGSTLIAVSDDGQGIPASDIPRIFNRTFRSAGAKASRVQGSGLGLYFVKMAVEAHGGTIRVASVEGKGSTFRISLPGTRKLESGEYVAW